MQILALAPQRDQGDHS